MVLRAKVDDELGAAVKSIAVERFDGNLSMAVRRLLEAALSAPGSLLTGAAVTAVVEPEFTSYEQMPRPDRTVPAPRGRSHEIENLRCKNCGWPSHRCKTDPVCVGGEPR